jgi:hypothetical protein
MSFFKIFLGSENQNNQHQNGLGTINHISQLDEIVALSSDKPVAIFKHSTM